MNLTQLFIIILSVIYNVLICQSYRLLAIFPFKGKSHFKVFEQTLKSIAVKGHQIDVIGHFPLKTPFPNYTDIINLSQNSKNVENIHIDYELVKELNRDKYFMINYDTNLCRDHLANPKVLSIIKNPPKDVPYDAVIMQVYMHQCFLVIGHLWDVPVIGIVTTGLYPWMHNFIGNPMNLAISSNNMINYKENMTFFQRLHNVYHALHRTYIYLQYTMVQDDIVRNLLGEGIPSVRELEINNLALILSNSHYTFNGIKPSTPALIEIGGIQVKDLQSSISLDLSKWLNESTNGFIYFTFGSMVALETFPIEILQKFYKAFALVSPIRFIIRLSNIENMPEGLPLDVFVSPWLPQEEILKHANIRAFVTHGGILGIQEAIKYKVPMICIPLFADQYVNCDIAANKNISLTLNLDAATESDFIHIFNELISNPKYRNSMLKFSKLFWDRPISPQETATFWIEYVIRNGRNILRSPSMAFKWWQIELLDIYVFTLFSSIFLIITIFYTCYFLKRTVAKTLYQNKKNNRSLNKID